MPAFGPFIPSIWTVITIIAISLLSSVLSLLTFAVGFALLIVWCTRSASTVAIALKWWVPFTLPLLIVHGVLNPSFRPDFYLMGWIPLRFAGFAFGVVVSLRILLISLAAASWYQIDRDRLFTTLVMSRLPISITAIGAVAMVSLEVVRARISAVYLAQQARGFPAGPGLAARIRALPKIVLPVVSSTLIEGIARGQLMKTRGLGATPMVTHRPVIRTTVGEYVVAFLTSLLLVVVLLCRPIAG